jgi:hypothetical protein
MCVWSIAMEETRSQEMMLDKPEALFPQVEKWRWREEVRNFGNGVGCHVFGAEEFAAKLKCLFLWNLSFV